MCHKVLWIERAGIQMPRCRRLSTPTKRTQDFSLDRLAHHKTSHTPPHHKSIISQAKPVQAMTASTMSRMCVLLALLVISSLHASVSSAFSIASLVTRRVRRIQPADGGVATTTAGPAGRATGGPAASAIRRTPAPSSLDPSLLEFNTVCQQAIADERRRHYYPTVREISEHAR
jgi:hypothetical protein